MSKRAIDLSQFDDEFRSEQPEERGEFESVPDGKYQVTVEKVELARRRAAATNAEVDAPRHRAEVRQPPSCGATA